MDNRYAAVTGAGECGVVGDVSATKDFADPALGYAVADPFFKVIPIAHVNSIP
jgi:hypothetical protein